MLSHERVWAAIDKLAAKHDLTPSGLAKRAGLDSTTFNKSKRVGSDGRARWPSTESLAKIVAATGSSLGEFSRLMGETAPHTSVSLVGASASGLQEGNGQARYTPPRETTTTSVPLMGLAQAGSGGFFDDAGFPVGEGWEQISLPAARQIDDNSYALEISGDSMVPLYREGDRVIVSPSASIKTGDRVVVKTRCGEVMAKTLRRMTTEVVELESANPAYDIRSFPTHEIEWMARIIWASQ